MNTTPSSKATVRGADLVVDTLVRLGVQHAFNVIGLGMYELGDAFAKRRSEIEYVSALNESNLTLMANGYARAHRKPAFACVYYSSGTSLAMIGLSVAWADRIPLVLCSTTSSRLASGRDQYAAVPRSILEMGAQYAKWSFEVPTVERIPEVIARAFAIASTPPMGPVHIAIPADLYFTETMMAHAIADFERTQLYARSCADDNGLEAAARLLSAAKAPVILAGAEVCYYDAMNEMVQLAERLGAPVLLEDQAPHLGFPTAHANYAGFMKANRALLEASDCVLAVGVEFTQLGRANEPPALPRHLKLISLSIDPRLPTKQIWPDIVLSGHPGPSLTRLSAGLAQHPVPAPVMAQRQAQLVTLRHKRAANATRVRQLPRGEQSVARWQIIDEMHRFGGEEWIIVEAGTTANAHFDTLYELANPALFYGLSGKASAQGWGAPTAIGIQLGSPDKRVLAFVGDGGLMFAATSIYSAARLKLPMIFVIANNGGWAHLPGAMQLFVGERHADMDFGARFADPDIDYAGLAKSLGLKSAVAKTAASLRTLLEAAGKTQDTWLIEVITDADDAPAQ